MRRGDLIVLAHGGFANILDMDLGLFDIFVIRDEILLVIEVPEWSYDASGLPKFVKVLHPSGLIGYVKRTQFKVVS